MYSAAPKVPAATAEMHAAAPAAEVSTTASTAEVSATATPCRLSGQGSHERHNRGQHDCANCNSAIFHEYLPPAAEKSDGPSHTPRYEMAACAALTYINIPKFTWAGVERT
jgi:hypothetical protein